MKVERASASRGEGVRDGIGLPYARYPLFPPPLYHTRPLLLSPGLGHCSWGRNTTSLGWRPVPPQVDPKTTSGAWVATLPRAGPVCRLLRLLRWVPRTQRTVDLSLGRLSTGSSSSGVPGFGIHFFCWDCPQSRWHLTREALCRSSGPFDKLFGRPNGAGLVMVGQEVSGLTGTGDDLLVSTHSSFPRLEVWRGLNAFLFSTPLASCRGVT